jgi:adenylate cyclase
VMFCDVRNFTSISETMTAQELTQFINQLLTPLTDIILKQRGTIDKYMGDAIMAFWNAPLDEPDHRRRACEAAVEMVAEMAALNRHWRGIAEAAGRSFPPVAIGVGINSGKCCVGNLGSTQRFDYSAIGDDVNVASRFEGLSKVYGVATVVGESTASGTGDLEVIEIDLMRVKGRSQPSRLYTINRALGCDQGRLDWLMPHHRAMLKAYRARDWDGAAVEIAACCAVGVPALDKLYEMYRSRIDGWKRKPPPDDWDGAFTALEK